MKWAGLAAAAAYLATIVVANYLVQHVGIVDVGFGEKAPAAVFAAGFAFTFRDIVQRLLGREAVIVAIVVGSLLSLVVAPDFALPSAAAFLVSELADFAVYTPLARRSFFAAVLLSNTVGLLIDSWLFLTLAFHSTEFLPGQVLGKTYTTIGAVAVVVAWEWEVRRRRAVLPRHA
jgi:uncharacterized PurR-regulated membrane protein YhhQ (DUF165 family)